MYNIINEGNSFNDKTVIFKKKIRNDFDLRIYNINLNGAITKFAEITNDYICYLIQSCRVNR